MEMFLRMSFINYKKGVRKWIYIIVTYIPFLKVSSVLHDSDRLVNKPLNKESYTLPVDNSSRLGTKRPNTKVL